MDLVGRWMKGASTLVARMSRFRLPINRDVYGTSNTGLPKGLDLKKVWVSNHFLGFFTY